MKYKFFLWLSMAFFLISLGCTKPNKALPSKDGKWTLMITEGGDIELGTMTFSKDGQLILTIDGDTEILQWSYLSDKKQILLSFIGSSDAILFDVKEQKRNYEKWFYIDGSDVSIWELSR